MKNFILNECRNHFFKQGIPFTDNNTELFSKEFLETIENNPLKIVNKSNIDVLNEFIIRYSYLVENIEEFKKKNKWIDLLLKKGNVYIVGGFNRDILTDEVPKDIDLVTDLTPKEIVEILKDKVKIDLIGEHFGVVMIKNKNKTFEIATFRKDIYHTKKGIGADEVEFSTIDDDWKRRDFTINSLYFDLKTQNLFDLSKRGIKHCLNKTLSFIGNPEDRLKEDYIRQLRFFKFIKKGFNPDKKSLKAVRNNWEIVLRNVNPERFRTEFEKLI